MKKFKRPFIKKSNQNNSNGIFKQLPEDDCNQVILCKYKKHIKGTITMLCVTTLVLSGSYTLSYLETHENNVFATESYTILLDGKEIVKVRDPELLTKTIKEIEKDLEKEKQHDLVIESKFDIVDSKARDKEILSEDELYDKLKSEVNYSLLGYSININGESVGVVDSRDKATTVIEKVKNYFTQNYGKESLIEVSTVEDVKIEEVKVVNKDIKNSEDLIDYIIKGTDEEQKYTVEEGDTYWTIAEYFNMSLDELISANPSTNPDRLQIGDELNLVVPKPFLNVQVKRKVIQEEKTEFETKYEYVSYMYNDEETVLTEGEYGVSEIEAIVTEQNGIEIAKEIVSEKVVAEPTTEVVVTGTQDPPPRKGTGYFINPLPVAYVSSRYGSRGGSFHRGQDMATSEGTSIKAADGGTVTFSGWSGSYGYMIELDHGGGFSTRYAHNSENYVSIGEKVYQGQIIGAVGETGVATGPHLHFEVLKYGNPLNPASYIGTNYR